MNKKIKILLVFFLAINVFFAAWYLLHGDIFFHTDIARDFLLLDELQLKKFVLIGPRASGLNGFFHGPLWMYLNFPVYLLSKGNPLAQGWFWFALLITYLTTSYFIWKKKVGADKALIFITLLSLFFTLDPDRGFYNGFYNPFGALFLMPTYFYLFYSYLTEKKVWQLVSLIFLNGLIIQFQIAFGGPLLILSFFPIIGNIVKEKKYKHIFSYFILLIPLSTYILFDLRHNFSHFRAIFMPTVDPYAEKISFLQMVLQRVEMITSQGLHFFRDPLGALNSIMGICIAFIIYFIITRKKDRSYLFLFLYFFLGYFTISLVHNGWVMYFYWMQLYPLTFLFFAHSKDILKEQIYYPILFFVIVVNTIFNFTNIRKSDLFIGIHQNSWKFEESMAETVFKDAKGSEFGFFIRAPDIFGYSSKYPFVYLQKKYPNTKAVRYEKKPLTYVIVEPAPKELDSINKEFSWWMNNKLHIATEAADITRFYNGFRIEKYVLKG